MEHLSERNPFDLSGGARQKAAPAKLLLHKSDILLLDEPTKGMDVMSKQEVTQLIRTLQKQNITTIIVTHDIEFAAVVSTRVGMLFAQLSENLFHVQPLLHDRSLQDRTRIISICHHSGRHCYR
ncbi:hypothetical protein CSV61_08925 [Sporosarcina sp. P3]|nr:hypothetical protein CSV61_08925 [Sporosarcina sp. P3]